MVLLQGRQFGQCIHRPLPSLCEPARRIFNQRTRQHGLDLSAMALVGAIHPSQAADLSQFYPVGCPVTATVEALAVYQCLGQPELQFLKALANR